MSILFLWSPTRATGFIFLNFTRPLLQTLLSLLVCSNVCRQSSNKKDVTGMYVHTWNVDDVVHGELNSTSN